MPQIVRKNFISNKITDDFFAFRDRRKRVIFAALD